MKRFTNGKLLDKDVAAENLEVDGWGKPIAKESPQTIRNVGHIDQLQAGQADLWKNVKRIDQSVYYLLLSQWETMRSRHPGPRISWEEFADAMSRFFELGKEATLWERAQLAIQPIGLTIEQIASPYRENLSKITKLFSELEEDFQDVPRRIVRCAALEEELAALENSLEDEETEYLGWCVSLIRDVLDYNYPEDLTENHLGLLKNAIDLVHDKGSDFNKEDYQGVHKEFLQTGLAILPTTQKAIEKYGE